MKRPTSTQLRRRTTLTATALRTTRGGANREFGGEDVGDGIWQDLGMPLRVQKARES